jgi:hypothetical protein
MQAKRAQHIPRNADSYPATPPPLTIRATGEIDAHLFISERHPIDAAITQSSADSRHRTRASRPVLI